MKPCPNCQQPVSLQAALCPNCGCILFPSVQERLMTGIAWVDVFLGVLAGLASPFLALVGFVVAIVLYFVLRQTYTAFARGLLIGILIIAALGLGVLALCFGMVAVSK